MIKLRQSNFQRKRNVLCESYRNLQAKQQGHIIWERIHIKNHKEGNRMKK